MPNFHQLIVYGSGQVPPSGVRPCPNQGPTLAPSSRLAAVPGRLPPKTCASLNSEAWLPEEGNGLEVPSLVVRGLHVPGSGD